MKTYRLIIFDMDDTLTPFLKTTPMENVKEWFDANPDQKCCIATNQGGVSLGMWMREGKFGDPDKYPTENEVWAHINKVLAALGRNMFVYVSYRFQSKKGIWSPLPPEYADADEWRKDWRKPLPGMLIAAMKKFAVRPAQTLMVGNSEDDRKAAENAGCDFMWAHAFFNRPAPLYDEGK